MLRARARSEKARRSLEGSYPGSIGELSPSLRNSNRGAAPKGRPIQEEGLLVHSPLAVEPLAVIHETDKTSSSGSISVENIVEDADRSYNFCDPWKIPNTYGRGGFRPKVGTFTYGTAFTPDELVEFMCANAWNFIHSIEGLKPGKLSNEDCDIPHMDDLNTANQTKLEDACAESNALRTENKRLQRMLKASEVEVEALKEAKELLEWAIDRWLKFEEFMVVVGVEYLRGARETKFLISKVDPGFDLQKPKEVRMEELAKTETDQPAETAAEEVFLEDSLDRADILDSNEDEKEEVQVV
ncbi:hypothetical protein ACOSQ3_024897 [Xanthoceras sorbifolium]